MNAGKSAILLQAAHNYQERGLNTLLFAPKIDDRFGVGMITSRIGLQKEAIGFEKETDLFVEVRRRAKGTKIACVLIDEAQFLCKTQVLQITLICDKLGIPVLCYGLRSDFRGEPFEGSQYLLVWADDIKEIKTISPSGRKATMNARVDADGNQMIEGAQVAIGTNYISLSRREFNLETVSPIGYSIPPEEDDGATVPTVEKVLESIENKENSNVNEKAYRDVRESACGEL